MFVDSVEILVSSGKGGEGAVSFRREKYVINGGPDGGDGGKGGDIYFKVDRNSDTLSYFRGHKHFRAKNGKPGLGRNKSGKQGESLDIIVPPGTQIFDIDSGELLLDLLNDGDRILFLKGGKGGLGNTHFKSSTNQHPTYSQKGMPGIEKKIKLELKMIANVGLIGFPNVGKSTLVSVLSNAKPEIANYEFTTLIPSLGIVKVGDYKSFVIADIPGIIEGASSGKGLGIEFLKHVERTQFLLFVLDVSNYRELKIQFESLKKEVNNFSQTLSNRQYGIVFSKMDTKENDNSHIESFMKEFGYKLKRSDKNNLCYINDDYVKSKEIPNFILGISSLEKTNLDELKFLLFDCIKNA